MEQRRLLLEWDFSRTYDLIIWPWTVRKLASGTDNGAVEPERAFYDGVGVEPVVKTSISRRDFSQ